MFIYTGLPFCIYNRTTKGGKEMFYLTTHSTHFTVIWHQIRRGNPLRPLDELLFLISSKLSFICTIPQTGEHIAQPLLYQSWSIDWIYIYICARVCVYMCVCLCEYVCMYACMYVSIIKILLLLLLLLLLQQLIIIIILDIIIN